jgi:hypothetical protein
MCQRFARDSREIVAGRPTQVGRDQVDERHTALSCCDGRRSLSGLFDQRRDRLRLGHVNGVTALDFNDRRACGFDISRWASGGIILSSVASKVPARFRFHAGSLIAPLSAATPMALAIAMRADEHHRVAGSWHSKLASSSAGVPLQELPLMLAMRIGERDGSRGPALSTATPSSATRSNGIHVSRRFRQVDDSIHPVPAATFTNPKVGHQARLVAVVGAPNGSAEQNEAAVIFPRAEHLARVPR